MNEFPKTCPDDESFPVPSAAPDESDRRAILGTIGLIAGVLLVSLAIIDATTGLPFQMPRSWYINRMLWTVFGVGCFVGGAALLRRRRYLSDTWKPSHDSVRFESIVLYTKQDCHLCDHAKDALHKYARYLPAINEIDIHSDPKLYERFKTCIPVVEIDGKIRFRGEINETLLRRLLESTPPRT